MKLVLSIIDAIAPFKPFIEQSSLSYHDQYTFFYQESILSTFEKKTLKFCLMLPKQLKKHPMHHKLFTYDSISYLLVKSTKLKIFQKLKAKNFIKSLYNKYHNETFSMTIITQFHLSHDLALIPWIKNKANVRILYTQHYHKRHLQVLQTLPTNSSLLVDYGHPSLKNSIRLNPIKVFLPTLSTIQHRYLFASLVHLHAKAIQVFIDSFLSIKTVGMHLYIELLDLALLPYPYVSVDPSIHFLPAMSNKERTSYIQHAYVNILAIDKNQPQYKVIYFDMLLQLFAGGIPLISTPNEEFISIVESGTYWLKSLSQAVVKKAFLHIINDDYSAMLQIARTNQMIVEQRHHSQNIIKNLNDDFQ